MQAVFLFLPTYLFVIHSPPGNRSKKMVEKLLPRARARDLSGNATSFQDQVQKIPTGFHLTDEFPDGGRASIEAAVRRLRVMLAQVVSGRPQLAERVSPLLNGEMGAVPFVNGLSHLLLPDVDARQAYVEMQRVDERIEIVETLLAGALADAVAHA